MLGQQAGGPWPAYQVRDTVAAIAQQTDYQRQIGRSLWDRFLGWVVGWIDRFFDLFRDSPATRWVTIALLVLLVALIVVRVVIVLRAQDRASEPVGVPGRTRSADPWVEAERLAAAGRYTDATHALLAAVLAALAARGEVRLHESKTTGDYARELERSGSPARSAFRTFRRRYDVLIYGAGSCTADDFAALRRDAEPTLTRARAA
jgi:hypothetical protein